MAQHMSITTIQSQAQGTGNQSQAQGTGNQSQAQGTGKQSQAQGTFAHYFFISPISPMAQIQNRESAHSVELHKLKSIVEVHHAG